MSKGLILHLFLISNFPQFFSPLVTASIELVLLYSLWLVLFCIYFWFRTFLTVFQPPGHGQHWVGVRRRRKGCRGRQCRLLHVQGCTGRHEEGGCEVAVRDFFREAGLFAQFFLVFKPNLTFGGPIPWANSSVMFFRGLNVMNNGIGYARHGIIRKVIFNGFKLRRFKCDCKSWFKLIYSLFRSFGRGEKS